MINFHGTHQDQGGQGIPGTRGAQEIHGILRTPNYNRPKSSSLLKFQRMTLKNSHRVT